MRRQNISLKQFISSRIFSVIILIILLFSLTILAKGFIRRYKINQEVVGMRREIESLAKDNARLNKFIGYSDTESFKEKEARLRLGLQKEGESVIVISPPEDRAALSKNDDSSPSPIVAIKTPNVLKWWRYFFNR